MESNLPQEEEKEEKNKETLQGMTRDRTFVIKGNRIMVYKTDSDNNQQLAVGIYYKY